MSLRRSRYVELLAPHRPEALSGHERSQVVVEPATVYDRREARPGRHYLRELENQVLGVPEHARPDLDRRQSCPRGPVSQC